jgi:hypothetical protein
MPTKTPTPIPSPNVTISPIRATVNNWVNFQIVGYPQSADVQITWRRLSGSTIDMGIVKTNVYGKSSGMFRVPATPGGPGQQITFTSGSVSKTVSFEVAPRIKVNTDPAVRGQLADVSLRGYARNETVTIRWKKGLTWVTLATVVTSNTGSANVPVLVPLWALDGYSLVRGDGTVFRQQTNVVNVQGGPFVPLSISSSTPTPGPSPIPTATPAATAITPETMVVEEPNPVAGA